MNTSPEHFERLVRYNHWANRRVAEMLTELKGAEVKRPLELFSHLLRAERVWLGRIYATPDAAIPLWETDPLGRCRERLEANARAFEQLVADGSADTEPVTYTTTQGTTMRPRSGTSSPTCSTTQPITEVRSHSLCARLATHRYRSTSSFTCA